MRKDWRWRFLGFESLSSSRPVQEWFNGLPDDAKDEIRDIVRYLRIANDKLWRKPEFDPLDGAEGISELRPSRIPVEDGGEVELATYRIYGTFWPGNGTYTFLHGVRKGVKNDRRGKRIAQERLRQLRRGEARSHEFEF